MKSEASWKAEMERQSEELLEAINDAIFAHGMKLKSEGRLPIMNALAGALVSAQACMLAAIEDPHDRKRMIKSMECELPKAIAHFKGRTGKASTIIVGGSRQ